MKKYLGSLLAVVVIAGICGCGDNKTKEKLLGTTLVTSTTATGGSFTSSPDATSMTALYKTSFMGAGAGNFSYSSPQRYGAPTCGAPSGSEGTGLGTPNADGEYVITDPMGMTVKIKFKNGSDTVYMNFDKVFTSAGLTCYGSQSLSGTQYTLGRDSASVQSLIAALPVYIPSIWIKASTGAPMSWYTLNSAKLTAGLTDLGTWMQSNFPDTMVNTVTGAIAGGTINMTMTTTNTAGRPTVANPVTMTGNGTITFDTGEVLTVTSNMSVGDHGPVSGTQTFSSSLGRSGVMTFKSDGSMDGTISMSGTVVATIHINADGTGTFTDVATGKTYSITGAKPA
jgi:hypothetical protein